MGKRVPLLYINFQVLSNSSRDFDNFATMQLSTVFNPVMINFLHFSYNIRRPPRWSTQIVIRLDWRWMEKRETSRQLRGRLQPNARNTLPPNIPLLRFKTQRNSRKCTREAKALRGRPRLQGKRRKVYFPLSCTPLRVLQREDYENLEKRSALLPTAYDKTSTGSYGVSFCSL